MTLRNSELASAGKGTGPATRLHRCTAKPKRPSARRSPAGRVRDEPKDLEFGDAAKERREVSARSSIKRRSQDDILPQGQISDD